MVSYHQSLKEITSEHISAVGLPSDEAQAIHRDLQQILLQHGSSAADTWKLISKKLLNPNQPFVFHQMMYYGCYKDYCSDTPPAWFPDKESATATNIGQLLERRGKEMLGLKYKDPITSFSNFREFSVSDPEAYWTILFEEMCVLFSTPPSRVLQEDDSFPGGKWLPGAYINAASCCLSLNDKRGADDIMIIWRDEGYDSLPLHSMTLKELNDEVCHVANALDTLGLAKGSSIAIDMPMNVKAVIIYLAIVLAGYVVVSIADSFAPLEISTRLKLSKSKVIFTQDYIIRGNKKLPLYRKVVDANAPLAIVISCKGSTPIDGMRDGDLSWHNFLRRVDPARANGYTPFLLPVEAFSNILFSSGTTGEPKAIPWTHITPLKAAADAWCHQDIRKGDVVAWPTNLGWMMGPWLVYATLLNGATIALYNGSPLGSGFAKFVQDAKVTMLGVVPSIVRAWKNENIAASFDWSSIRCFSSTGEASSVDEYLWLMGRAHYKPIIEYCGGTEIGGAFVTGSLLQPQALAAFSTPAMGCSLYILDVNGNPIPNNVPGIGELALGPNILGASAVLLNADHYDVYFKGMPKLNGKILRRHGDEFERNTIGYYRAHGRADDTMNLGGIKVSSVEIERVCNGVDDNVLETAAVGLSPTGGGPEQLIIAVVFKNENVSSANMDKLKKDFNIAIQKNLNPLFKVSSVVRVPSLPRTASNKVMRRVLRRELSQPKHSARL